MEVWVPINGMQIVQNLQCQINCFLQNKFLLDCLGQNAYPQNFVRTWTVVKKHYAKCNNVEQALMNKN